MFERFAVDAREVVVGAQEEARLRGDRRLGTEHLFLGVLRDPGSIASRAVGADLQAARAALQELDRAALALVGIDDRGVERPPIPASSKHTPFTSSARSVMSRALVEVRRSGSRRIGAEHLLLAVLACERPNPAVELIERLGIDAAAVRQRVARPTA